MLYEKTRPDGKSLELVHENGQYQQDIEMVGLNQVRVVMGYDQHGRLFLPETDTCFLSRNLLPEVIWKQSERYSLLVEALYLRQESLGYIVFETAGCEGGREGDIYDALKMQISSAIKQPACTRRRVQPVWKQKPAGDWRRNAVSRQKKRVV